MSDPNPPLLKEIFNDARLRHIATQTAAVCNGFDKERFVELASENLDVLSIMQRMRQVATSLYQTLPGGFAENVAVLEALAPRMGHGFAAISLCEYVALYGEEHFELAMKALRHLTRFGSAEFAVRPFLRRDLHRTLAVMPEWAHDQDEHVRRLASEGSRPRLPWSFRLESLAADPDLAAPILETLKRDPSTYVRKSVANHLNDVAKEHPDWVVARLSDWPLDDKRTAWIARHALRSLIKQGHPKALALIGAAGKAEVRVDAFAVTPATILLGERIRLDATLTSIADAAQRLVVDYAVEYVKRNGSASRKVFKLKEFDLAPGETRELSIGQTVRDFTTRKHHAGHHRVMLLVNGEELAASGFDLSLRETAQT